MSASIMLPMHKQKMYTQPMRSVDVRIISSASASRTTVTTPYLDAPQSGWLSASVDRSQVQRQKHTTTPLITCRHLPNAWTGHIVHTRAEMSPDPLYSPTDRSGSRER